MIPPYLGTSKAARWLGLSERTVRLMATNGSLNGAFQPSGYAGSWLIPLSTLEGLLSEPVDPSFFADFADPSNDKS